MSLSGPIDTAQFRIISLGAGVQSTCMALMAAHGEITPMPDCAVFADTQSEPAEVYDHLRWLMSDNVLPFPVNIVTQGSLKDSIGKKRVRGEWDHLNIPVFHVKDNGVVAMTNRSCTRDYKITPLRREARRIAGLHGKRSPDFPIVEQWIGISTDEIQRMKDSREKWWGNRFPLIEKNMTRKKCLAWMEHHGYPRPAKSACTFCPYHNEDMWKEMKRNKPHDFEEACEIDRRLRAPGSHMRREGTLYLHRKCIPLEDIDFSTSEDHGQLNMFLQECDGMCGV